MGFYVIFFLWSHIWFLIISWCPLGFGWLNLILLYLFLMKTYFMGSRIYLTYAHSNISKKIGTVIYIIDYTLCRRDTIICNILCRGLRCIFSRIHIFYLDWYFLSIKSSHLAIPFTLDQVIYFVKVKRNILLLSHIYR